MLSAQMYRPACLVILLAVSALAGCGGQEPAEPGGRSSGAGSYQSAPPPSAAPEHAASPANTTEASSPGGQPAGTKERSTAPARATVEIVTSLGTITAELDGEKAPETVANFLSYARRGFYDGTIFHRVIPNFMIQGGGYTRDLTEKETDPPIRNEGGNGLRNLRGTLAMARTSDPDSATAQFFINVVDNGFLDRDRATDGYGYAVFGKVVEGMDVVDRIKEVPTGTSVARGLPMDDVPKTPVVIQSIKVVN